MAYELAQLNIAQMQAPLDSPELADFVGNLDRVNALAEQSPGYRWRLQTEEGNATGIREFGDDYLVNLSVWEDVESLRAFVYSAEHVAFMRRRREWFASMREAYFVMWWVPTGQWPDIKEARDRLQTLRTRGPSEDAFTFQHNYPAPT